MRDNTARARDACPATFSESVEECGGGGAEFSGERRGPKFERNNSGVLYSVYCMYFRTTRILFEYNNIIVTYNVWSELGIHNNITYRN